MIAFLYTSYCSTNGLVPVTSLHVHSAGVHSSRSQVLVLTIIATTQGNPITHVDQPLDIIQLLGAVYGGTFKCT